MGSTIAAFSGDRPLRGPTGREVFSEDVWCELTATLRLSGRESEIVQAVFDDRKESAIAADLGISTHTVHSHLERLYRKLHVSSRVTLVVRVFAQYVSHVEARETSATMVAGAQPGRSLPDCTQPVSRQAIG